MRVDWTQIAAPEPLPVLEAEEAYYEGSETERTQATNSCLKSMSNEVAKLHSAGKCRGHAHFVCFAKFFIGVDVPT